MKKSLIIGMGMLLLMTSPSMAKGQGVMTQTQDPTTHSDKVEPQGNTVKNQVKTQNAGEDSQLMVNTQESLQENDDATGSSKRSAVTRQNMSVVAKKVQGLLEFKEDTKGIGAQVREIAKAQNSAQDMIQEQLNKLDSRGSFMRSLFGTNRNAVKNLNQQMEQNQLRIEQLEELKNQLINQADETQIEEAIQALIEQNTALADQIQMEEKVKGMFGFIIDLFN